MNSYGYIPEGYKILLIIDIVLDEGKNIDIVKKYRIER